MKCPKCGFTGFESNDSCSKCGNDLQDFREAYNLTPLVMPASLRATLAAQYEDGATEEETTSQESGNDMFSFELPHHDTPAAADTAKDPFDFSTPPPAAPAAPANDDPFAELLEAHKPEPIKQYGPQGGDGNELNNFSWDETPTPSSPGVSAAGQPQKPGDDFESLFGDLDGGKK